MSRIAKNRNPLPKLQKEESKPQKDPLEIEPLPEANMFAKKKEKKQEEEPVKEPEEQVRVNIEEKVEPEHTEAPLLLEKKKKPKKKRILTDAHKARLEAGRKKGLETRRKRAAERKAKAQAIIDEKNRLYQEKLNSQIEVEHQKTLKVAKKMTRKNSVQRQQAQVEQIKKADPKDPDKSFKKFYNNMARYQKLQVAYRKKIQEEKTRKAKEEAQRSQPKKKVSWGYQRKSKPLMQKPQTNNPYMSFFT